MNSQKLIKQEIIDHNLQVKAIIQVSRNKIFTKIFTQTFCEIKFQESQLNLNIIDYVLRNSGG